jgi:hypothetical protein
MSGNDPSLPQIDDDSLHVFRMMCAGLCSRECLSQIVLPQPMFLKVFYEAFVAHVTNSEILHDHCFPDFLQTSSQ